MSTKHIIAAAAFTGLLSGAYAAQTTSTQKAASLGVSIEKMADKGQHTCKDTMTAKDRAAASPATTAAKARTPAKAKAAAHDAEVSQEVSRMDGWRPQVSASLHASK